MRLHPAAPGSAVLLYLRDRSNSHPAALQQPNAPDGVARLTVEAGEAVQLGGGQHGGLLADRQEQEGAPHRDLHPRAPGPLPLSRAAPAPRPLLRPLLRRSEESSDGAGGGGGVRAMADGGRLSSGASAAFRARPAQPLGLGHHAEWRG